MVLRQGRGESTCEESVVNVLGLKEGDGEFAARGSWGNDGKIKGVAMLMCGSLNVLD